MTGLFRLAYQSIGVIYGDIGTSPLYVYSSTFSSSPSHDDLLGALSLIIWTVTLMVIDFLESPFLRFREPRTRNADHVGCRSVSNTSSLFSMQMTKAKAELLQYIRFFPDMYGIRQSARPTKTDRLDGGYHRPQRPQGRAIYQDGAGRQSSCDDQVHSLLPRTEYGDEDAPQDRRRLRRISGYVW